VTSASSDFFRGIDAKLERALVHFDHLWRAAKAFTDCEPFSVRIDKDGDVLRFFAVDRKLGPPPQSIVLIAGEAVYQLRSSLDHLIYQLVLANGHAALLEGSRTHQFPIFETPAGYESRAARRIAGVLDAAQSLIEAVQPYHREQGSIRRDPLWLLQDLNNTDKHKVLPLTILAIGIMYGQDSADGDSWADSFTVQGNRTLEDNREIFRLQDPKRQLRARISSEIAFREVGSSQNEAVIPLINRLIVHVNEVIGPFRELPEFHNPTA
jgi:hypothetical protein